MSKEGQRHAQELARLEQRKKDLEDALMRLARDEAEAEEVAERAQEVDQLEQHVESARAAAKRADPPTLVAGATLAGPGPAQIEEKTMTTTDDVRKRATENRLLAEANLNALAKSIQQPGETFEKAYDRALDTPMGQDMMALRDDAQELERGGVTSMELEEARKNLAG